MVHEQIAVLEAKHLGMPRDCVVVQPIDRQAVPLGDEAHRNPQLCVNADARVDVLGSGPERLPQPLPASTGALRHTMARPEVGVHGSSADERYLRRPPASRQWQQAGCPSTPTGTVAARAESPVPSVPAQPQLVDEGAEPGPVRVFSVGRVFGPRVAQVGMARLLPVGR